MRLFLATLTSALSFRAVSAQTWSSAQPPAQTWSGKAAKAPKAAKAGWGPEPEAPAWGPPQPEEPAWGPPHPEQPAWGPEPQAPTGNFWISDDGSSGTTITYQCGGIDSYGFLSNDNCDENDNTNSDQKWEIAYLSNSELFQIKHKNTGKCVGLGGSNDDRSDLCSDNMEAPDFRSQLKLVECGVHTPGVQTVWYKSNLGTINSWYCAFDNGDGKGEGAFYIDPNGFGVVGGRWTLSHYDFFGNQGSAVTLSNANGHFVFTPNKIWLASALKY